MMLGMQIWVVSEQRVEQRQLGTLEWLAEEFDAAKNTGRRRRIGQALIRLGRPGIEELCRRATSEAPLVGNEVVALLATHPKRTERLLRERVADFQDPGAVHALEEIERRAWRRARATRPPSSVQERRLTPARAATDAGGDS